MRRRRKPQERPADTVALILAALQVILPYFFVLLAAVVGAYLVFAALFR